MTALLLLLLVAAVVTIFRQEILHEEVGIKGESVSIRSQATTLALDRLIEYRLEKARYVSEWIEKYPSAEQPPRQRVRRIA